MAGDVADGLIGHPMCSTKWLEEVVVPNFERGLTRSERDRVDFDFIPTLSCAISDDVEAAYEAARRTICFYATVRTYAPPGTCTVSAVRPKRCARPTRRGTSPRCRPPFRTRWWNLLRRGPRGRRARASDGGGRACRRCIPHATDVLHLARRDRRVPAPNRRCVRSERQLGQSASDELDHARQTLANVHEAAVAQGADDLL